MPYAFALFVCTAAVVESLWLGLPLDLEMGLIFSGPVLLLVLMMAIGLVVETIRLVRSGYGGSAPAALDVNYNLWFLVVFSYRFWQGFAREDSALRLRFLLGFTLTWFLGTGVF